MDDKAEFEQMRDALMQASQAVHELLPRVIEAAFHQGGRAAAQRLAEMALSYPTSTAPAKELPRAKAGGSKPGRGKVIGRIVADIRSYGEAGTDEAAYRQSLIEGRIARSSIHMALKRLVEIGTVVRVDGRLYHDAAAAQESSDEEPGDAGESSSGSSSEQHQEEDRHAAPLALVR